MRVTSAMLLMIGVLIAIAGTVQFVWVVATAPDPNPNPVGSGMLMVASWWVGAAIAGVGLYTHGWRFPWV
jgi:hypothetical protein